MKRIIKISITAVLFALLIFLCSCKSNDITQPESTSAYTDLTTSETTAAENQSYKEYYDCPEDFEELKSVNGDVYAYIVVPGTNIKYPVLISPIDDNYYLRRDWKKRSSYRGCIFTQSCNATDFSDPVTVVYGHNTDRGDMFSVLLNFKEKTFFDENEFFYIYQPDRTLVYRIFSAHTYDTRHIMNSYDFTSNKVLADFQDTLLNPQTLVRNVRDDAGLSDIDRVVILSTCAKPRSGSKERFLVNGVLKEEIIFE
ncbi:MAG: class B sortase [Clostridiales bacterium]|nr:class B sortase [Clostridiales bacterium]